MLLRASARRAVVVSLRGRATAAKASGRRSKGLSVSGEASWPWLGQGGIFRGAALFG